MFLDPRVPAGGSAEIEFYDKVPVVVSDPTLVKRMLPAVERVVGRANVQLAPPVMAADDFALFAQRAPAFFFLGHPDLVWVKVDHFSIKA